MIKVTTKRKGQRTKVTYVKPASSETHAQSCGTVKPVRRRKASITW